MFKSGYSIFMLVAIVNLCTHVTPKHTRDWGVPLCSTASSIVKDDCLAAFQRLPFDESGIYTVHGTPREGDLWYAAQKYGTCRVDVAGKFDGCRVRREHLLKGLDDQPGSGLEGLLNKCIANKQSGAISLLDDPKLPTPEPETPNRCHWRIIVVQTGMDS